MSRRRLTGLLALAGAAALAVPAAHATGSDPDVCRAQAPLSFSEPTYVDKARAGGEPLVATLPDGRLLYSAHAGTTHFFTPAAPAAGTTAFAQNYTNQTYIWTSADQGKTWTFRPRYLPPNNAPLTGFSDPEVAIDAAGNVFFSEINLANVAMSKSTLDATQKGGEGYTLQNFFGAVLTDRQWQEADRKDEVYFVANAFGGGTGVPPSPGTGHYISKSVDGGKTFTTNVPDTKNGSGFGDIRVDKVNGTVYEMHGGSTLYMNAFRKARLGKLSPADTDSNKIASGVSMLGHWPAFDIDPSGNLYAVWDESGKGARGAGIWYSTSTNSSESPAGTEWSEPVKVSEGTETAIWPWIAVGDEGRVGISWLEASVALPNNNAETAGTHGWYLNAAATDQGLGCDDATTGERTAPSFSRTVATKAPVHTGTICQGGTTCQAMAIDRRLGDYFSMDVDATGRMYLGYSDTRTPAAVALPGFVRQDGGPALLEAKAGGGAPASDTGQPRRSVDASVLPR